MAHRWHVMIVTDRRSRHVDDVTARTTSEAMQQAVDRYGGYLDRGARLTVALDPNSTITAWDRILDDDLGIP